MSVTARDDRPRCFLVTGLEADPDIEAEVAAWYRGEHAPEQLALPGINSWTWWRREADRAYLLSDAGSAPRWVSLFGADSRDAFDAGPIAQLAARGETEWSARLRHRFTRVQRGLYEEVAVYAAGEVADMCVLAFTTVAPTLEEAYTAWYDTSHGPALARVPGVAGYRRLVAREEPRHLTQLLINSASVLGSAEFEAASRASPDPGLRERWQRERATYSLASRLP